VVLDVDRNHPQFGKAQPCPSCTKYVEQSGLKEGEANYDSSSIKGNTEIQQLLRFLIDEYAARPYGFLTLWGDYGTAKSMVAMAITAAATRKRMRARYEHAKEVERNWLRDTTAETSYTEMYRTIQVLVIDEVTTINMKNDWVRSQFSELVDARYRTALEKQSLTIFISQTDPGSVVPGDVFSRLGDGAFYRKWTKQESNQLLVDRWGGLYVPPIVHVTGPDARPYRNPDK